jgi:putative FmdB family regulatory protein
VPIYEYVCNACGKRFEQFTWSSAEAGEAACPDCGARDARRVMSLFGVGRSGGAAGAMAPEAAACGPDC